MEKSELRSMLIDYLDGNLDSAKTSWIEDKIENDKSVALEYEEMKELMGLMDRRSEKIPDNSLESGFFSMLDDEIIALEDTLMALGDQIDKGEAKVVGLKITHFWQVAAAVLLVGFGTLIGMSIMDNNSKLEQISAELKENKKMVIDALENTGGSPLNRIKGVNASLEIAEPDAEIIDALIDRMQNDDNTNVRLAAIEALINFMDEPKVNEAFIAGLVDQKVPIVQITLINILVKMKEKKALKNMQKIIEDKESMNTVKDEAQLAVYKLS